MSFVKPEIPISPDCLFRTESTSCAVKPSLAAMKSPMAGSMSPERVPITKPSSGVNPIEVSTESPARIADAEQPFPRCSVMTFVPSRSMPRILR